MIGGPPGHMVGHPMAMNRMGLVPPPPLPPPLPSHPPPSFCMEGDMELHEPYNPEQPLWGGGPRMQGANVQYAGQISRHGAGSHRNNRRQNRDFEASDTIIAIDTSGGEPSNSAHNRSYPRRATDGSLSDPKRDNANRNRRSDSHFTRARSNTDQDEEDEENAPNADVSLQDRRNKKRMRFADGERPSAKFTIRVRSLPMHSRSEDKIKA